MTTLFRLELEPIRSHYDREADILEVEFGEGVLRKETIAYGDIYLFHVGAKPDAPGAVVPQGMTFIGFQRIRERIHGKDAGPTDEAIQEGAEFLRNIEVEVREGGDVLLKDLRYWDSVAFRFSRALSEHVEWIQDIHGNPLGLAFRGGTIGPEEIGGVLDLIFDCLLGGDQADSDPHRQAFGKAAVQRWIAPLFAGLKLPA